MHQDQSFSSAVIRNHATVADRVPNTAELQQMPHACLCKLIQALYIQKNVRTWQMQSSNQGLPRATCTKITNSPQLKFAIVPQWQTVCPTQPSLTKDLCKLVQTDCGTVNVRTLHDAKQ